MRVSDAERESVAARLRDALEAGRLDLPEFDQRSRDLYEAQTYAEVNRLLEDLPSAALAVPASEEAEVVKPGPPEQAPPGRMENGMGIAALATGVMSVVNPFPFPVLAIVFGSIGMSKAKQGKADNGSAALAGMILGAVSIPLWVLFFVFSAIYWW